MTTHDHLPIDPNEWDELRRNFRGSIMMNTDLNKLAQNIGAQWPLRGEEETPQKYVSMTLEELLMYPELASKPERIQLLRDILSETLAFDDPFGDMVEQVDSSSKKDESAFKTLRKLDIPSDFPIKLVHFPKATHEFCQAEGIATLNDFIAFSQNMAQSIVVGGDFRRLLNSLTHQDNDVIAEYLPLNKSEGKLNIVESFGLLAGEFKPAEQKAIIQHSGGSLPSAGLENAPSLDTNSTESVLTKAKEAAKTRLAYFSSQAEQLHEVLNKDRSRQERYFVSIDNPARESTALALAKIAFDLDIPQKKKGFWKRLFQRN